MAILFSNEILNSVKHELENAKHSVQIITAYCKESSFEYLNNCIDARIKSKRLLVRFRMDDILTGSTDFSIIRKSKEKGWDIDTDATTVEEAKEAILKALKLPLKKAVSEKTDPGKGAAL